MQRRIIPDIVKDQQICALSEDSTIYAAAKQRVDSNVAAVVVKSKDGNRYGA